MLLEGSCHCGAVRFSVESKHPYPFNVCYCGICRKTAGSGGTVVNIKGKTDTLKVEGEEHVRIYRARMPKPNDPDYISAAERRFCDTCGSALWVWDPHWPEMIHPFASAIDTPLPVPPERTHLMLAFRPAWVAYRPAEGDKEFDGYPDESIAAWHERLSLADD